MLANYNSKITCPNKISQQIRLTIFLEAAAMVSVSPSAVEAIASTAAVSAATVVRAATVVGADTVVSDATAVVVGTVSVVGGVTSV